MSGTSLDAIDVAVIDLHQSKDTLSCQLLAATTTQWPPVLREQLLEISQNRATPTIDHLASLDAQVGMAFAHAANMVILEKGICRRTIKAIGSHGQTIRHRPTYTPAFTWQIGDPNRIAEHTGITTVADFRRRDIAAGGQGAPLLPAFHHALLHSATENRAVVNLGGIANITLLPRQGRCIGFDTGPANALLDCWFQYHHPCMRFDRDGNWAKTGKVHLPLLERFRSDPWFRISPPKSTGREYFHLEWIKNHFSALGHLPPQDVQATLLALTSSTICDALKTQQPDTAVLFAAGGGVHHPPLMDQLRMHLPDTRVISVRDAGIDPDYLEAMGFAWFAAQTLHYKTSSLASITGAQGARILGGIYLA